MPDQQQAKFTYPGIQSVEELDMTDIAGVSPSTISIQCYPQWGLPKIEGDLVLTQDGRKVTIKKCRIGSANYTRNSGGQIVSVMLTDERWRWGKGYVITGRYNTRLPNNEVDPFREKKPVELVKLLFDAMDVSNYEADLVESDADIAAARPDIDWDVSNPAQELQSLLDSFGLRLVPRRTDGKFVICRTGEGATLAADNRPYQDPSEGIDPQEVPDALTVFGPPIRHQVRLELEAVGREIWDEAKQPSPIPSDPLLPRPTDNADGSIKPIDELTYAPKIAGVANWKQFDEDCTQIDRVRVKQPDGSLHSPQDLARQSVYRMYRVKADADGKIIIPSYSDPVSGENTVTRKQLILTNELLDEYIDPDGAKKIQPAFCDFVGFYTGWEGTGNAKGGTRLEAGTDVDGEATETVTFSINLDGQLQTISFSKAMMRYNDGQTSGDILPAKIWLTCAVEIRHPETWQPIRYEKSKPVPGAPPLAARAKAKFIQPLRHDDVKAWFKTYYDIDEMSGEGTISDSTDNTAIADTQADYYLDSQLKAMETVNSKTLTLIGIWPVDMDGAINQISYRISKSGADTTVSRGTEHDVRIPTYKDQQQRIKRTKLANEKAAADMAALKAK
jgi:hypothetical protein